MSKSFLWSISLLSLESCIRFLWLRIKKSRWRMYIAGSETNHFLLYMISTYFILILLLQKIIRTRCRFAVVLFFVSDRLMDWSWIWLCAMSFQKAFFVVQSVAFFQSWESNTISSVRKFPRLTSWRVSGLSKCFFPKARNSVYGRCCGRVYRVHANLKFYVRVILTVTLSSYINICEKNNYSVNNCVRYLIGTVQKSSKRGREQVRLETTLEDLKRRSRGNELRKGVPETKSY